MKTGQGCDALARSLTGMLREANNVRRAIGKLQDATRDTRLPPEVEDAFVDAADFCAGTFDDVSDRLNSVEQVLRRLGACGEVNSGWRIAGGRRI